MGTAYLRMRFQKQPQVNGNIPNSLVEEALDNSIPSDLPDNWQSSDIFPVLYLVELGKHHRMICRTDLGEPDEFGRPNLLTRAIVSDEPLFFMDPTSLLDLLSSSTSISNNVIRDSFLKFAKDKKVYADWISGLSVNTDIPKMSTLLASVLESSTTYVIYDDISKFTSFVRLTIVSSQILGSKNITFDSFCSEGLNTKSSARIRGVRVGYLKSDLDKDQKKLLKRTNACLIDFTRDSIFNERKSDEMHNFLLQELKAAPWLGLDRYEHLLAMNSIQFELRNGRRRVRDIEDLKGITDSVDRIVNSVERVRKLIDMTR